MGPQVHDSSFVRGRLAKAQHFAEAASLFFDEVAGSVDLRDAYATLAIHSGIASSDVICAARLGEYSAAGSHHVAIGLLRKADSDAAVHLSRLLEMKTRAGYSHRPISNADVHTAHSAHTKLLLIARATAPAS